MSPIDARNILQALADGFDPIGQHPLEEPHVLLRPPVIRALFKAIDALDTVSAAGQIPEKEAGAAMQAEASPRPKSGARQASLSNAGARWNREQDEALVHAFKSDKTIAEIAVMHGRTRGAITSRLIKLGHIQPPAETGQKPVLSPEAVDPVSPASL